MKRICLLTCCFSVLQIAAWAQYAPQAGLPGSTAIIDTSHQFIEWATQCTIQRGFMDIANPSLGYASAGDNTAAIGAPDHNTVSLGDSGIATLTFLNPIYDGPGADFAVFENGFPDPDSDSLAFLELGFVEVSSDGVNYTRFPATSYTQTTSQFNNDSYINCTGLNNLAGNYLGGYGTPFDLSELAGTPGLDINNITHIRIIDVVGSIGAHASRDAGNRVINDPYPTPYASCGFDLDAVGVINKTGNASVATVSGTITTTVYPNPATDQLHIAISGVIPEGLTATITTITGNVLQQSSISAANTVIPVSQYPAGMYYILFRDANGNKWADKFTKR